MNLLERFPDTGINVGTGEEIIYQYLRSQYENVSDYRNDMTVQRQGVDFGFRNSNHEREFTMDAKSNLYVTASWVGFKIELSRNGNPGWLWKSKADYIYHICSYKKQFLYYDIGLMRYYISNLPKEKMEIVNYGKDVLLQLYIHNNKTHEHPSTGVIYIK